MTLEMRERIISSLGWSGLGQVTIHLLNITTAAVLARLLVPEQFGLVTMGQLLIGFASLFADLGLGTAIVQRRDIDQTQLSTIFWINLGIGVAVAATMVILAPAAALFFEQSIVAPVVAVLGIQFVFNAAALANRSLLRREMQFGRLFAIDGVAAAASSTVAIVLALFGFGIWSLVGQALAGPAIAVVALLALSNWRPGLRFDLRGSRSLLRYGMHLSGFNVFNYWARNFDNLLIGRVLGSHALGLYSIAYRLIMLPLSMITSVFTPVMLSSLSKVQDDLPRFREIYLRSCRTIAVASFPIVAGLFVASERVILLVLGPQWLDAAPIFKVLAISGLLEPVGTTAGWIYMAVGRTDTMFRWGFFSSAMYVVAFLIGIQWGVMGVAIAYVVAGYLVIWYPSWTAAGDLVGLSFQDMLVNVAAPLLCAITMAAVCEAVNRGLLDAAHDGTSLVVLMLIGSTTYIGLLALFRARAYTEVVATLAAARKRYFAR